MYLLWLVIRSANPTKYQVAALEVFLQRQNFTSVSGVLLLGPTMLAVVTTQQEKANKDYRQNGQEVVDNENDDVAENEVDEE